MKRRNGIRMPGAVIWCTIVSAAVFFAAGATIVHAAAVTMVQATSTYAGGNPLSEGFNAPLIAGDTIVVITQYYTSSSTPYGLTNVADTLGNHFTVVTSTEIAQANPPDYPGLSMGEAIAYATGTPAGVDTVTATFGDPNHTGTIGLLEITPGVLSSTAAATGTSASPSAGTVVTTKNGAFGIANIAQDDGLGGQYNCATQLIFPGAGWTIMGCNGGGSGDQAAEYQAQASAGAMTGNFSYSSTSTWAVGMATFVPAGTPPGISSFGASPSLILANGTSTLYWSVSNATSLSIDHSIGTVIGTSTITPAIATSTLFTLTAANAAGTSTATATVAIDAVPPTVPLSIQTSANSDSAVTLSWTSSTDVGGPGLGGYAIFRCVGSCVPSVLIATSSVASYQNMGLAASTAYTYAVSAYDILGFSSATSTAATVSTLNSSGASIVVEVPMGGKIATDTIWYFSAGAQSSNNGVSAIAPATFPITGSSSLSLGGSITAIEEAFCSLVLRIDTNGIVLQPSIFSFCARFLPGSFPQISFYRNLAPGMRGADVRELQFFLNTQGFSVISTSTYAGSLGYETRFFGPATEAALVKFQAAYGIPATGYFGPITRGYIERFAQ